MCAGVAQNKTNYFENDGFYARARTTHFPHAREVAQHVRRTGDEPAKIAKTECGNSVFNFPTHAARAGKPGAGGGGQKIDYDFFVNKAMETVGLSVTPDVTLVGSPSTSGSRTRGMAARGLARAVHNIT